MRLVSLSAPRLAALSATALTVAALSTTLMPAAALAQPAMNGARSGNNVGIGASNLTPADTHSAIAPNLPIPAGGADQRASDLLKAAQGALAAGRTGEAQQALEMAQTRMLDRSVPIGQTNNPSDNPTVQQIDGALQALAAHDRTTSMQLIQTAIGSASAQGL
jgi:hypothetical protein